MRFKQWVALGVCAAITGLAMAQEPPERPNVRRSPDEAVKTILDLSDAQLQELKELRASVEQKRQDNAAEIRRLQQKQRELLQVAPPDAVALADVMVQQENLRKQIQEEDKAFRDTAMTLLTASQREKVEQIQEALQLVRDAGPLAQFGLIERPARGFGMGPGPGFVGAGPRFQGQFEAPVPPSGR
jgi:Spy/CpxP family protein refolding chaperone